MSLTISTPCTEKWRLHELDSIIDSIEAKISDAVTENNVIEAQDYINIILHLAGKSILSIREVMNLSAMGYPDGALSLARNLYEQLVVTIFLEQKKDDPDFGQIIEDYFIDYSIQQYKCLIYESNKCKGNTVETYKLKQELKQIKEKAHNKTEFPMWWTGHDNLNNVVEAIIKKNDVLKQCMHNLHLIYKRACLSLHSSCLGNSIRVGIDLPFNVIDTSPRIEGHGYVLYFATKSLILILGVACGLLNIEFGDYERKLDELISFYNTAE